MPKALQYEPAKPEIHIYVNPATSDITVAPTVAHLETGLEVKWKVFEVNNKGEFQHVANAGYLLTFRDVNAMGTNEIRGGPSAKVQQGNQASPPTTRKPGRYHYKVMVSIGDVIYADVGCPSMILR